MNNKDLKAGTTAEQPTDADVMNVKPNYTPNPLLCAVSHEDVAVMFLEWAHSKYWRTAKRVGHKWFKLNSSEPLLTTKEVFKIFMAEMEEELSAIELSAYYSNLEKEASKLNAL